MCIGVDREHICSFVIPHFNCLFRVKGDRLQNANYINVYKHFVDILHKSFESTSINTTNAGLILANSHGLGLEC